MLNAEKYKEEIENLDYNFSLENNEVVACYSSSCCECIFDNWCRHEKVKWLLSEYEEPPKIESEVYKLKCDDRVEVSNDGIHWKKQHLKFAEGNVAVAWSFGKTSFSAKTNEDVGVWEYARIPREE